MATPADHAAPRGRPGSGPGRGLLSRRALVVNGFTLAALLAWWAYAQVMPAYILPGPVEVAERMVHFLSQPRLRVQLLYSVSHVLAAIGLAFAIGTAMAFSAHYLRLTRLLIDGRIIPFLNSFSAIGWLFLAILWFGMDSVTVIFAVTMILIPFTAINIRTGLEEQDAELIELGRSLSRSRLRAARLVLLPMLMPYVFAALRTSFGVSWKVVLTAELFGGNAGVGYILNVARQEFDTETVFAIIAFILLFVALAEAAVFRPLQGRLDRKYSRAS